MTILSSGRITFIDDFEDGVINPALWTVVTGTSGESDGVIWSRGVLGTTGDIIGLFDLKSYSKIILYGYVSGDTSSGGGNAQSYIRLTDGGINNSAILTVTVSGTSVDKNTTARIVLNITATTITGNAKGIAFDNNGPTFFTTPISVNITGWTNVYLQFYNTTPNASAYSGAYWISGALRQEF